MIPDYGEPLNVRTIPLDRALEMFCLEYRKWLSDKSPYESYYPDPEWIDDWRNAKAREIESCVCRIIKATQDMTRREHAVYSARPTRRSHGLSRR